MAMVLLLLLGGCTGEVLTEENTVRVESERAIVFDNGFVDNSVQTRALTALCDHSTTMGVWGWRSDSELTDEPLFIDQLVAYDNAADWTYSPLRYWEQHSTYRFNAYAPHSSDTRASEASVTVDDATGLISIYDVKLTGDNIRKADASHDLKESFVASSDIDWMVARAGQTAKGSTRMRVQFVMQHILSKFNVRIRIGDDLAANEGLTKVTLKDLTIGTFYAKGSFEQALDHTPSPTVASDLAADEWTVESTPVVSLVGAPNVVTDNVYTYVLESLILPQSVRDDMTVLLHYSFTYSDGHVENYTFQMPLKDAFGVGSASGANGLFVAGCSYTLSFLIDPNAISFDAGLDEWTPITPAQETIE